MQKTCTSCGHQCHISHGKCTKCKAKVILKIKQPVSPSKLERKHMDPIWKRLMLKVCKCLYRSYQRSVYHVKTGSLKRCRDCEVSQKKEFDIKIVILWQIYNNICVEILCRSLYKYWQQTTYSCVHNHCICDQVWSSIADIFCMNLAQEVAISAGNTTLLSQGVSLKELKQLGTIFNLISLL